MTELNYRYIMGFLYDNTPLDEISANVENPIAHVKINNKTYALDDNAIKAYERYKNSLESEVLYLSKAADIPYAVLYQEIIGPIQMNIPVESVIVDDIYKRSLFDFNVHEAVCECLSYDKRIFENILPITDKRGKTYDVGDFIVNSSKDNIFSYKNTIYVLRDKEIDLSGLYTITAYQFNDVRRTMDERPLYKSINKDKLYPAMVADVLAQQQYRSSDLVSSVKLAMHMTNTDDKTMVADCINAYSNRIAENTRQKYMSI